MDDQHLDELFRNDLEPDYDKFDEANWEAMESKLNGIAPKANKLPLMNVAQYATMVVMLGISMFAFWQINEGNKAIDSLTSEVEELKKDKLETQAETTKQFIAPALHEEPKVTVKVEEPKETKKAAKQSAKPKSEKKAEVAEVKAQKSEAQLAIAEGEAEEKPELTATQATPKYYMLVNGEFVPVAEFDHPGAEQGDSARSNENIASEANN